MIRLAVPPAVLDPRPENATRVAAGIVAALALAAWLGAVPAGATEHTFTGNCLPPGNSQYAGQFHAAYGGGVFDLRNPIHDQFTACDPPPLNVGDFTVHLFSSLTHFDFSSNGGATYSPFTAPAQVTVRVQKTQVAGGLETYQTEMLQLDISGGTLPAGAQVRESPTQPSTGQTTIRDVGGGLFHIDSFFDVFTELSVDGGQTWMPTQSPPGHMDLGIISATPARTSTWGSLKAHYR